ncbi:MAG TPA: hypothetical protein VGM92_09320 [Candidatus Kapabacteria bacterium]
MKARYFTLFAGAIALSVSLSSCTKTVTVTQIVTKDSSVVDTIGLAMVRFVSMLPPADAQITIFDTDKATPFTNAQLVVSHDYIPVVPNTLETYYFSVPAFHWFLQESILPPGHSFYTYALFFLAGQLGEDSSLDIVLVTDSERFTPAPPGQCWVRFLDGVSTFSPNAVYLETDTEDTSHSIFKSGNVARTWSFTDVSPYVLMPAGNHIFYADAEGTNDPEEKLSSKPVDCLDGGYYSIRAVGTIGTDAQLVVDQE